MFADISSSCTISNTKLSEVTLKFFKKSFSRMHSMTFHAVICAWHANCRSKSQTAVNLFSKIKWKLMFIYVGFTSRSSDTVGLFSKAAFRGSFHLFYLNLEQLRVRRSINKAVVIFQEKHFFHLILRLFLCKGQAWPWHTVTVFLQEMFAEINTLARRKLLVQSLCSLENLVDARWKLWWTTRTAVTMVTSSLPSHVTWTRKRKQVSHQYDWCVCALRWTESLTAALKPDTLIFL